MRPKVLLWSKFAIGRAIAPSIMIMPTQPPAHGEAHPANQGEANPARDVAKGIQKRTPAKHLGANSRRYLNSARF